MRLRNKKIIKVTMYVLLLLGGIGIMNIPVTYSSFQENDDTALVYKSKLYGMYSQHTMTLKNATLDTAKFELTFKPNAAVTNYTNDKYEIVIPSNCTFDHVSDGNRVDKTTHSITFGKDVYKNKIVYVNLDCSVEPNKKLQNIVKIKETVDDQETFLYIDYVYIESYSDYLKHVVSKVENSQTISGSTSNLYDTFIAWITQYGKSVGFEDEIVSYVKSKYPNESALKNSNNFNALLGFSITYDSTKNEYTYNILENFLGYARTYELHRVSSFVDGANVFFNTKSNGVLTKAFKDYLDNYLFPNDKEASQLIYDYICDGNKLYNLIFSGTKYDGLTLKEYNATSSNSTVLVQKVNLLSTAGSAIKKIPYLAFGTYDMMKYNFGQGLLKFYSDLSMDTMRTIRNRTDILDSITKNNSSITSKVAFTDYFVQKDGNRDLLIKVTSEGKSYNTFTITPIVTPSDMVITFTNSGNNLTIRIKHTTKASVMQTVTDLNKYFNTSIGESNVKVITDTSSEYTVEYTITK